jgi:hypothetical protein
MRLPLGGARPADYILLNLFGIDGSASSGFSLEAERLLILPVNDFKSLLGAPILLFCI